MASGQIRICIKFAHIFLDKIGNLVYNSLKYNIFERPANGLQFYCIWSYPRIQLHE